MENKKERIVLRVSKEQKEKMKQAAKKEQRSLSNYILSKLS